MIEVYHRKQPTFELYDEDDIAEHRLTWARGGYTLVATVELPEDWQGLDEEYAFHMTNTIEKRWTENKSVTPMGTGHRSTSVGDVVKNNNGMMLICAPSGWIPL